MKKIVQLILLTLGSAILSFIIGLYGTLYVSYVLTLIVITAGGLYLMIYLMVKYHWAYVMTAIFVLTAGVLTSIFIHDFTFWITGDVAENVSLSEAVQKENATVFYFNEGKPNLQIVGEESFASGQGDSITWTYVVPVVDEEWTIDQPVYVWADCQIEQDGGIYNDSFNDCVDEWNSGYMAGLRDPYSFNFHDAIKNAEKNYHVVSDENAVIIRWVKNPREEIRYSFEQSSEMPLLLCVFALSYTVLVFFLLKFIHFVKSRKSKLC